MIRFILVALFLALYLILGIPVLGVLYLIGLKKPAVRDLAGLRMVQWAFRMILKICGLSLTVIGEENVPKDQPVLYIGNHRSYFDVLITYARCPGLTGYMAKKEMLHYPLLRDWMKLLHCQFIDRSDVKQGLQIILNCIESIKNGISICIFPEGTRNKVDHTFLPFHEGSFKVAIKTGCAIVPMTLNNAAAIFEDHAPAIKKAHVVLEYGKPIYVKDLPKEDQKRVGAYVQSVIEKTYEKNRALV